MSDKYFKQYYANKIEALETERKLTASPMGRINLDLVIATQKGYMDMCESKSSSKVMDDYNKALKKSAEDMKKLFK